MALTKRIYYFGDLDITDKVEDYGAAVKKAGFTDVIFKCPLDLFAPYDAKAVSNFLEDADIIATAGLGLALSLSTIYMQPGQPNRSYPNWADTTARAAYMQTLKSLGVAAQAYEVTSVFEDSELASSPSAGDGAGTNQANAWLSHNAKELDLVRSWGAETGQTMRQAFGASATIGVNGFHAWEADKPGYHQFFKAFFNAAKGPRLVIDETGYNGSFWSSADRDNKLQDYYGAPVCLALNFNMRTDEATFLKTVLPDVRAGFKRDNALMIFPGGGDVFGPAGKPGMADMLAQFISDVQTPAKKH